MYLDIILRQSLNLCLFKGLVLYSSHKVVQLIMRMFIVFKLVFKTSIIGQQFVYSCMMLCHHIATASHPLIDNKRLSQSSQKIHQTTKFRLSYFFFFKTHSNVISNQILCAAPFDKGTGTAVNFANVETHKKRAYMRSKFVTKFPN